MSHREPLLPSGVRRLFRLAPTRPEQTSEDADEEIRLHLKLRAEQLMRDGFPPATAQAEAERRFGALDEARPQLHAMARRRETRRQANQRLEELGQDIRFAWRSLRRARGFAALVVATLAIGIGAVTAIFSVVNGVLLRPLPYADPDAIVAIHTTLPGLGAEPGNLSIPELADVDSLPALGQVAAFADGDETIAGDGSSVGAAPERVRALYATASLFDVLQAPPHLGRAFTAAEDRRGEDDVAVLSHRYWERRFGADPAIVGKTLVTDAGRRTITGVMSPRFTFGDVDLYLPLALGPADGTGRGRHNYQAIARLAPGASTAQADAQLEALTTRLRRDYPEHYPGTAFTVYALGLHESLVGDARAALRVLAGVVGLVLLIACANAANLLLARSQERQRELAVRAALGAGKGRIIRQLLVESALLALAAGALGVAFATWAVRALLAVNPDAMPRHESVTLDPLVAGVALGVSLITGILFGILPAVQASRPDINALLRSGGRTGTAQRGPLRRSLVISEIALSVMVVVSAALLLRSFSALRGVDAGLDARGVLTLATSLPSARYPAPRVAPAYDRILEELRAIRGVEAAGAMALLPLAVSGWNWNIIVEGQELASGEPLPAPRPQVVTPGALEALRISLARGRGITGADGVDAPLVALVNETMARTLWPGEDPLGKRFRMAGDSTRWTTVVGIVNDVRAGSLREPAIPEFYVPLAQFTPFARWTMRSMTLVLRTDGDPALLAAPARRALAAVDPGLAASDVRTMRQVIDRSVAQPRFTALLLSAFGTAALLLATVGVYGVMSYGVAQRTREFGIRVALGARASDVVRLVVGQGLVLAVIGVAVGVIGALAATRALRSLLYGVSPTDPVTFFAIGLLLLGVVALACVIPARRATRADPTAALRAD